MSETGQASVVNETKTVAPKPEERIKLLEEALMPFAKVPYDPAKKQEEVLYRLSRQQATADIKNGDVIRAKKLLGLM